MAANAFDDDLPSIIPDLRLVRDPLTGDFYEMSPEEFRAWEPRAPRVTAQAAPLPEQEPDTEWADWGRLYMAGSAQLGQGIGWLAKQVGLDDVGTAIDTLGSDAADYWTSRLSPAMQKELAKEFVVKNDDGSYEWGDAGLKTALAMGAQSVPGTMLGMGVGGGITKILQTFANPVGRGVLVEAVKAGSARGAAPVAIQRAAEAAKKLKVVDSVLGAGGFGLGEGLISGMIAGPSVRDEVLRMDPGRLAQNPRYQEILASTDDRMSELERHQYAAQTVAEEAASLAGLQSGLVVSLFGAPMGAFFGRLLGRPIASATAGRAGTIAVAAAGEAGQEAAQSGAEAVITNRTLIGLGDDRDLTEGVLNQMVGGAVAGGLLGGAFGTMGATSTQEKAEERTGREPLVMDRAGMALAAGADEAAVNAVRDDILAGRLELLPGLKRLRELETAAREAEDGDEVVAETPIDEKAHEAAPSPLNDRPEPTDAQIEAGNYKKGKVRIQGLPISIENPAGSTRRSKPGARAQWETRLKYHYGYIRGTRGRDGNIDVNVGPGAEDPNLPVVVIDQGTPTAKTFDEHKVMLGFADQRTAIRAYQEQYSGDVADALVENMVGATEFTPAEFKRWLREGDTTRPASEFAQAQPTAVQTPEPTGMPTAEPTVEPTAEAPPTTPLTEDELGDIFDEAVAEAGAGGVEPQAEPAAEPATKPAGRPSYEELRGLSDTDLEAALAKAEAEEKTAQGAARATASRIATRYRGERNNRVKLSEIEDQLAVLRTKKMTAKRATEIADLEAKRDRMSGKNPPPEAEMSMTIDVDGTPVKVNFALNDSPVTWEVFGTSQAHFEFDGLPPEYSSTGYWSNFVQHDGVTIPTEAEVRATARQMLAANKKTVPKEPKTPEIADAKWFKETVNKLYAKLRREFKPAALESAVWASMGAEGSLIRKAKSAVEQFTPKFQGDLATQVVAAVRARLDGEKAPDFVSPAFRKKAPAPAEIPGALTPDEIKAALAEEEPGTEIDIIEGAFARLTVSAEDGGITVYRVYEGDAEVLSGTDKAEAIARYQEVENDEAEDIDAADDEVVEAEPVEAEPVEADVNWSKIHTDYESFLVTLKTRGKKRPIGPVEKLKRAIGSNQAAAFEAAIAKIPGVKGKALKSRYNSLIRVLTAESQRLEARAIELAPDVYADGGVRFAPAMAESITKAATDTAAVKDALAAIEMASYQVKGLADIAAGRDKHELPEVVRFASGLSRITDLTGAGDAVRGMKEWGPGVDVGELSQNSLDKLANLIAMGTTAFVDSGAFSLFRRQMKADGVTPIDFDAVLEKYDAILNAVEDADPAESGERGPVLLVMPDVVGDQAASIALIKKYKRWISAQSRMKWARPVVPIQTGDKALFEVYAEAVKILGTDDFIVGVPSNEKAVSLDEFNDFLRASRPKQIHFLGTLNEDKLAKRVEMIRDAGIAATHISADANVMRGSLYGRDFTHENRRDAISKSLLKRMGREVEREIFRAAVDLPAVMEAANREDFADVVIAEVNKWVAAEEAKEGNSDVRAVSLVEFRRRLEDDEKFRADFVGGAQTEARRAAKAAELAANRDPELYNTALREAADAAGVVTAAENELDADMMTAFKQGFDHALAGKTRSTLSGDHQAVRVEGYNAAVEWRKTPEGEAWFTGKRGQKLKDTGAKLRRMRDIMQERLREARKQGSIAATWDEIKNSVERAALFDPQLAANATPGLKREIDKIRSKLYGFKEAFKDHYSNWMWDRTFTFEALLERLEESERRETAIETMMTMARDYAALLETLSAAFDGAQNLKDLWPRIDRDLREATDDGRRRYRSLNGEKFTFRSFSRGSPYSLFDDYNPANGWLRYKLQDELKDVVKQRKTPLRRPRLDKISREGRRDYRGGKDVTPATVKATFGLADVGFGKWVRTQQDQDHLNYAYDAFMDLADVVGIEPVNIGFGGKLHLTIGALGAGRHAAHFNWAHPHPDGGTAAVINVTNTKGDGTVAHEWGHALDYFLQSSLGGQQTQAIKTLLRVLRVRPMDYVAYWEKVANDYLFGGWSWGDLRKRKASVVEQAKAGLTRPKGHGQNQTTSNYHAQAAQLDKGSAKLYWSNDREMVARAFEAFVYDAMGESKSDYLVTDWVADGKVEKPLFRGTPYPKGDERETFNAALKTVVGAIAWKDGKPEVAGDVLDAIDPGKRLEEARKDVLNRVEEIYEQGLAAREAQKIAKEIEKQRAAQPEEKPADITEIETEPTGPLSEDELNDLFDDAIAQTDEREQEEPDEPAPGEIAADIPQDDDRTALVERVAKQLADVYGLTLVVGQNGGGDKYVSVMRGSEYLVHGLGYTENGIQEALDWVQRNVEKPTAIPPPISGSVSRQAKELIKEAAKQGVTGIDEALTGLAKLFGGNSINAFPGGFDETRYQQARPHFEAALRAFQAAGKTLKDLAVLLYKQHGDGIKPYFVRFARDYKLDANLAPPKSPSMTVAEWVKAEIAAARRIEWQALFERADAAWGGTQATGAYSVKDAYDALEAGINLYLKEEAWVPEPTVELAKHDIGLLNEILGRVPTQTKRTAEMDEFQQFSTPPTYAYVANWVANPSRDDVVLEPSAGIGGLAVFAQAAGAELVMNELSARRKAVLDAVFPEARTFSEDAAQLNNILPADVMPSLVIMNPPFSATAGRMAGVRDTMEGAKHVEQALKRLAEGGRLVAIVGEGMAADKPAFKAWWREIRAEYNVRANIGIDGRGYAKYGTTFSNQIVVIDKTGPTTGEVVTGFVQDVAALPEKLEGIRNDRQTATQSVRRPQPESAQPGGAQTPAGGAQGGAGTPRSGTGAVGGANVPAGGEPGTRGGRGGRGTRGRTGGQRPRVGPEMAEPGAGRPGGAAGDATDAGGRAGADAGGQGADQGGVTVESGEFNAQGELTDSVFESYKPAKLKIAGAKPHPGDLVESAAMASLPPPDPTYTPNLPANVITDGKLSLAQLETPVYAGQAYQQILADGSRRGFLLGDGTGVGKGRQIAAIIMDQFRRGKRRHVWVSLKKDLANDALRDAAAIELAKNFDDDARARPAGWKESPAARGKLQIFRHGQFGAKDSLAKLGDGLMFTMYSTLRGGMESAAKKKENAAFGAAKPKDDKKTRLDQLAEWLGDDFDGVIVFDEAHAMANAIATKDNPTVSQQAEAGVALAKRYPKAMVVYVSATAATEVTNLGYADRLGLWGKGTAFAGVQDFIAKVGSAGVAAMELVARDLKALGLYLARSLSFDGIKYERLVHNLDEDQRAVYDVTARAWQIVLKNINDALEITKTKNPRTRAFIKAGFWSTNQRFFNQLLTALQIPSVIEAARRDYDAGHAVVFQIENTNAAAMDRKILARLQEDGNEDNDGSDLGLEFSPMESLIDYVNKAFPTQQYEDYIDEDGKKGSRPVFDSQGNPVENAEAVAKKKELLGTLEAISKNHAIPGNPLDLIIEEFGPDAVAEVTGRGQRVIRKYRDDGSIQTSIQKRNAASNDSDSRAFMDDRKRVLIFSKAGGTGFSYHASLEPGVKNRRLRRHYLLQPGWSANVAVQGFGRTHRTFQKQPPEYVLVMTDLSGHKRFVSSVARRLDQLGALTRGERRATSQLFNAEDNLENQYAQAALIDLFRSLSMGRVEGFDFNDLMERIGFKDVKDKQTGAFSEAKVPTITRFMNAILSLEIAEQNALFDEFFNRMEEIVAKAVENGTYDVGMETLTAIETRKTLDRVVATDAKTQAETRYVRLEQDKEVGETPWSEEEKYRAMKAHQGVFRDEKTGEVFSVVDRGVRVKPDGSRVHMGSRRVPVGPPRFVDNVDSILSGGPQAIVNREAPQYKEDVYEARRTIPDALPDTVFSGGYQREWLRQDVVGIINRFNKYGEAKTRDEIAASELPEGGKTAQLAALDYIAARAAVEQAEISVPRYTRIAEADAEAAWEAYRTAQPKVRQEIVHMITGVMLPLWDRFPTAGKVRVGRVQTRDGERLLGRILYADEVDAVLQKLGVNADENIAPDDLYARVSGGASAVLSNGWRLTRVRVSNDNRVEIIPATSFTPSEVKLLVQQGAMHERIEFKARYFVPNADVLARIMTGRGVVKIVGGALQARRGDPSPGFYSPALRAVETGDVEKAKPLRWLSWLKGRPNVKQAELDFLGIEDWLKQRRGDVTRTEIAAFIRANQLVVTETLKGAPAGTNIAALDAEYREIIANLKTAGYEITGSVAEGPLLEDADGELVMGGGYPTEDGVPEDVQRMFERYVDLDVVLNQSGGYFYDEMTPDERRNVVKFPQLQTPGGESYRELLLTMPGAEPGDARAALGEPRVMTPAEAEDEIGQGPDDFEAGTKILLYPSGGWISRLPDGRYHTVVGNRESLSGSLDVVEAFLVREYGDHLGVASPDFMAGHWEEPNVLVHVRFNDRVDADGKRVLFLEEIQSDWHQEGRKTGYADHKQIAADEDRMSRELRAWAETEGLPLASADEIVPRTREQREWLADYTRRWDAMQTQQGRSRVPDAPFKASSEWAGLAFKRMVRWAAEHGYDRIAWTTGDQQNERYTNELRQKVDMISWHGVPTAWPGDRKLNAIKDGRVVFSGRYRTDTGLFTDGAATGKPLEEVVGKQIAKQALDPAGSAGVVRGDDLMIGGKGFRDFYDDIVVNVARKLGKRFGVNVGTTRIGAAAVDPPRFTVGSLDLGTSWTVFDNAGREYGKYDTREAAEEVRATFEASIAESEARARVHSMDITPALRDAALAGQPVFQRDGGGGMRVADVEAALGAAIKKLGNIIDFRIVQSAGQVAGGTPGDTAGVYWEGTNIVYLVADNLRNADDAVRVFTHEVFGHLAPERHKWFGDALAAIRRLNTMGSAEIRGLWDEVGARYGVMDPQTQAKEVLALMAERGSRAPLFERLMTAVRTFLRSLGLAVEFTEADLRGFIRDAGRGVERAAAHAKARAAMSGLTAAPGAVRQARIADDLDLLFGENAANGPWGGLAEALTRIVAALPADGKPTWADWQRVIRKEIAAATDAGDRAGLRRLLNAVGDEQNLRRLRMYHRAWNLESYGGVDTAGYALARAIGARWEAVSDGGRDYEPASDYDALRAISAAYPSEVRKDPLYAKAAPMDADLEQVYADTMGVPHEEMSLGDRIRAAVDRIRQTDVLDVKQGLIDSYASIKALEEDQVGAVLDASESAYKAALATRNHGSVMAAVFMKGVPEYRGGALTPVAGRKGIMEIFAPLTNHPDGNLLKHWKLWAAATRASRLADEGRERLFTPDQIEAALRLGEQYPEFQVVMDDWQDMNRQALDLAEGLGVIDGATRSLWERNDYVPFYRVVEEMETGPLGKRGIASQRNPIRTLTGGEDKLGDVLENMLMNLSSLIDRSHKNAAMQRVVGLADGIAMQRERLPWRPQDYKNADIKRALEAAGIDMDAMTDEQRREYTTLFHRVAPRGPDIVSVLEAGRPVYYRVLDPLLLRSVLAMGPETSDAVLRLFGGAKRLLTSAVTADPAFALANYIRDTLSNWVVSGADFHPLTGPLRGARQSLMEDETVFKLMMAGGGGGGYYESQPEEVRKLLRDKMPESEIAGFVRTVVSPRRAWNAWHRVLSAAENANRLAIFNSVVEKGGSEAEAAYQARDVLNFSMRGDYKAMQWLITTVPFMNARVQGLYRLARGARDNPQAFAMRGLILMAVSVALLAANDDDERYDQLPEWDKDVYWHVFVGDEHFRIPKPFEVGLMFATLPERMIRFATGQDSSRVVWQQLKTAVLDTLAFNPVPQLVKPILEQYANRNSFTGTPIVGMNERGLEPEAQFNSWTSETARAVAAAMPDSAPEWLRSPVRLQAAIRGYLGSLGAYAMGATDYAVREIGNYPEPAQQSMYDFPVVRRFLRDPNPRTTKYTAELYDMLDEANSIYRTIKVYRERNQMEMAAELLAENRGKLAVRGRINALALQMREINRQINAVQFSGLSAEDKRKRVEALIAKKNEVAARVAPYSSMF